MGSFKRKNRIRYDFLRITLNEIEAAISGQEIDAFLEALVNHYQNKLNFGHLKILGNGERLSILKKAIIYRIQRYHPAVKILGNKIEFAPGWGYDMEDDDYDDDDHRDNGWLR